MTDYCESGGGSLLRVRGGGVARYTHFFDFLENIVRQEENKDALQKQDKLKNDEERRGK